MGTVNTCAHILLGGYEISADCNRVEVNSQSEMQDKTTFGSATRMFKGGLFTDSITVGGFLNLESSGIDPILWGGRGVNSVPVTVFANGIPVTDSTHEAGYGVAAVEPTFNFGGNVGIMLPFDTSFVPDSGKLARAFVLENFLSSAATTGILTGASKEYTHCSTSEQLYAGLHVTALSTGLAASVIGIIQAASSSGFSTSSTRVTFSTLTCKAGLVATPVAASALSTDQPWYRSRITVSTGSSTGPTANGLIWMSIE
jgi:hypothetical protein